MKHLNTGSRRGPALLRPIRRLRAAVSTMLTVCGVSLLTAAYAAADGGNGLPTLKPVEPSGPVKKIFENIGGQALWFFAFIFAILLIAAFIKLWVDHRDGVSASRVVIAVIALCAVLSITGIIGAIQSSGQSIFG